ncbi:phospholipase [Paenibacillus rhizovicinus]|uniref:Phospholipase n=1 Tax=Paenibacillus rhizovicinus TaxID=2704463 RepID=A0A6C0P044_9BACL|nr:dienelactone hydrolase family protein [Paenibacillus rhizovicinus]QHW31741.1 phospholipase [Paenibacillus rhizovicinus]
MPQQAHRFHKPIIVLKQADLPYLLHQPDRSSDSGAKWPLILFLHGRDQRGNDVEQLKIRGLPRIAEDNPAFPFIVLAPQCPSYYIWPMVFDGITALLDEVIASCPVDPERIFVTGLSMGGYGAWDLAMEYPERFAGVVPVCGSGSPERIGRLRDVQVWAFHGTRDEVVPVEEARELISALGDCGGNGRLTEYPEGGHAIWEEAYATEELYSWFFRQRKAVGVE